MSLDFPTGFLNCRGGRFPLGFGHHVAWSRSRLRPGTRLRLVMHEWAIEAREYARHETRRGRRHAYEQIDPTRTALVVIDLVPFFLEANPYARGIVGNIVRLAEALRNAGGIVAWVVPEPNPPTPSAVEFFGPAVAERYATSGGDGPPCDRVWREFEIVATDIVVEKSGVSAFFPGGCELSERLRERNVDTVLIAGTVANVCCESSARDASTLGYRVLFVADANAAMRDQDLNATLHTIYRSFGDVRTTDEVIGLLDGS